MSSISNSATNRRRLLGLLAAWPLAELGGLTGVAEAAPESQVVGFKRWGSGKFRRYGFLVYEATLWAVDHPLRPPLALQLTYLRNIDGRAIAEASVKEIRQLGMTDEATLQRWGQLMAAIFPDVRTGDQIVGIYLPEGAQFQFNGRPLGSIDEAAFARAFFSIWLDEKTSAPELRLALLKLPAA